MESKFYREKVQKKAKIGQKGITLIALVITIVVLLILAGVTIGVLFGDDGLIKKASQAKNRTEQSSEEEQVQMAILNARTNLSLRLDKKILHDELVKLKDAGVLKNDTTIPEESANFPWEVTGKTNTVYTIDEKNGIIGTYEDGGTLTETAEESTSAKWQVEGNKIVAYKGNETDVTVPNKVDGVDIKEIGTEIFYSNDNKTKVKKLKISNGIEKINQRAFDNCTGLTGGLLIPDTVTEIGNFAFNNCTGMDKRLKLSSNCTTIGSGAFCNCKFTGNLIIPEKCTQILSGAFSNCSSFSGSLVIPKSCAKIDTQAFYNCTGFKGDLIIYGNELEIGNAAFEGCSGFKGDIIIGKKVKSIANGAFKLKIDGARNFIVAGKNTTLSSNWATDCGKIKGTLYYNNAGPARLYNLSGYKNLKFGADVATSASGDFYGASSVEGKIILPENYQLSDSMFGYSDKVTDIYLMQNDPEKVNNYGLGNYIGKQTMTIHVKNQEIYDTLVPKLYIPQSKTKLVIDNTIILPYIDLYNNLADAWM